MANWSDRDSWIVDSDMEAYYGKSSVFYLKSVQSTVPTSGYDPIYRESLDVFAPEQTSASYVRFYATVIGDDKTSDLYDQGFHSYRSLKVDVPYSTVTDQGIEWRAGLLVMHEGVDYRVKDVDLRGISSKNRLILLLDEVT